MISGNDSFGITVSCPVLGAAQSNFWGLSKCEHAVRFEFNRLNALFAVVPSLLASSLAGVVIKTYAAHRLLESPMLWASRWQGYNSEVLLQQESFRNVAYHKMFG